MTAYDPIPLRLYEKARGRFAAGVTDADIARTLFTIPATHVYRDTFAAAALIRGTGHHPGVVRAILDARAGWLDWLTVSQRHWQSRTRRESRARHHDSIAIRERYVRCHDGEARS
jgi:hypothetical protein